ncbi:MAG: iron-sulfur cluster assembly scaffold protein [Candidatus Acidiferrales bacterium]
MDARSSERFSASAPSISAFADSPSTVNFPLMYSAAVLDHFKNPRNPGDLPDATAVVDVENPVCGDVLRLAARLDNGKISAVRFKAQGCVTALACASALTELLAGKSVHEARLVTAAQISDALGGLPQATFHGAQLAADALAALLAKLS